jgi:hypothetical protein
LISLRIDFSGWCSKGRAASSVTGSIFSTAYSR